MHACLSLGFEGVYRASGGPGALQGIRRDLYETIRRAQPKTIEDLSPHWRGQIDRARGKPVSGSGVVGRRRRRGDPARDLSLSAQPPCRAGRSARDDDGAGPSRHRTCDCARNRGQAAARPGPRSSTQLERIRAALAKEILAGKVDADPVGDHDLHSHRQRGAVSLGRRARSTTRSRRSPPRSPPRSTRSRARSTSTGTPTAIRSTPLRSRRISSFPRRAPSRSRRC